MRLKFRPLHKGLERVWGCVDQNPLHHFYRLNLLNVFTTSVPSHIRNKSQYIDNSKVHKVRDMELHNLQMWATPELKLLICYYVMEHKSVKPVSLCLLLLFQLH